MDFKCNICGDHRVGRSMVRGDNAVVLFCQHCDMGVVESIPADTSVFYEDSYYGANEAAGEIGYQDYEFTADHSLLWVKLAIESLCPVGRVLDVGCANGHLLQSLVGQYDRFGIEVNALAADAARKGGVNVIASDLFSPVVNDGSHGKFDLITSIATFEHVNDFKKAFDACLRSLADRGVMIFEVPLMSYTRDNKDWLHASYEHVFYPTVKGMDCLFEQFPDHHFAGFESDIAGYSSTYIGAVARDLDAFARVEHLLQAMKNPSPDGLAEEEVCVNLAYNVVHSFNVTADRVLALPTLVRRAYSFNLVKRLTQLWHGDRVASENAGNARANADWYEQQATNWQDAWNRLHHDYEELQRENASLFAQLQSRLKEN